MLTIKFDGGAIRKLDRFSHCFIPLRYENDERGADTVVGTAVDTKRKNKGYATLGITQETQNLVSPAPNPRGA
jgi:hypothetical protein